MPKRTKQGRPVRVKHDAYMHHGQNRENQCENRREYALFIIGLGGMEAPACQYDFITSTRMSLRTDLALAETTVGLRRSNFDLFDPSYYDCAALNALRIHHYVVSFTF